MATLTIKTAKANHKQALKSKAKYIAERNHIIRAILGSHTPKWGVINVIVTKI